MKAFITSQFGYCPLVWMFHSRQLNNQINRLHERSLSLIHKDRNSSFYELLIKDNTVTIHQINLKVLAAEIYKSQNNSKIYAVNLYNNKYPILFKRSKDTENK